MADPSVSGAGKVPDSTVPTGAHSASSGSEGAAAQPTPVTTDKAATQEKVASADTPPEPSAKPHKARRSGTPSDIAVTEPGVWPQRPYTDINDLDLPNHPIVQESGVEVKVEKGVISFSAPTRDAALALASNLSTLVSGDLTMKSYQATDENSWYVELTRKES